jgi:hypothetical protein
MRVKPGVAMRTCSMWKGGRIEPTKKTKRKRMSWRTVTITFFMD